MIRSNVAAPLFQNLSPAREAYEWSTDAVSKSPLIPRQNPAQVQTANLQDGAAWGQPSPLLGQAVEVSDVDEHEQQQDD